MNEIDMVSPAIVVKKRRVTEGLRRDQIFQEPEAYICFTNCRNFISALLIEKLSQQNQPVLIFIEIGKLIMSNKLDNLCV